MKVSTGLTRARRFQAALALVPIPASKVLSAPLEIAELDKHNCAITKSSASILSAISRTPPFGTHAARNRPRQKKQFDLHVQTRELEEIYRQAITVGLKIERKQGPQRDLRIRASA